MGAMFRVSSELKRQTQAQAQEKKVTSDAPRVIHLWSTNPLHRDGAVPSFVLQCAQSVDDGQNIDTLKSAYLLYNLHLTHRTCTQELTRSSFYTGRTLADNLEPSCWLTSHYINKIYHGKSLERESWLKGKIRRRNVLYVISHGVYV